MMASFGKSRHPNFETLGEIGGVGKSGDAQFRGGGGRMKNGASEK